MPGGACPHRGSRAGTSSEVNPCCGQARVPTGITRCIYLVEEPLEVEVQGAIRNRSKAHIHSTLCARAAIAFHCFRAMTKDDEASFSLTEYAEKLQEQGRSQIARLLAHADPVELFVATLSVSMCGPPDAALEAWFGTVPVESELLAYEIYPHFPDSSL